ncbi:MAG TPA: hypothetical protein VLH75_18550 [Longimicrobiales bacterium]|nr:hypothetical protein [Longimicrobiales bacterium]
MPRIQFPELPDRGRVWVFPASRPLAEDEERRLLTEVDAFLDGWAAHGAPLRSAREMVEGWFLLVGVDEDASRPSGCSIDALVNRLEALGEALGVSLVDRAPVWYRADSEIRRVNRQEFKELARTGAVDPDTRVFDTSLIRLEALRAEGLERAARKSWHGFAFFRDAGVAGPGGGADRG